MKKRPGESGHSPKEHSTSYYSQLSRFPSVTAEQEREFFTKYLAAKDHYEHLYDTGVRGARLKTSAKKVVELRNHFVERNLKFVIKVAKNFWMDGIPENFENLISAGNIGLIESVDRFDPDKGVRFLTYAVHWIALEIRLELAGDTVLKVPIWWQKTLKKIYNAYVEICAKTGSDQVCVKRLSKESEVPLKHIMRVSQNKKTVDRRCFPTSREDTTLDEHHFIAPGASSEDSCIYENAKRQLKDALAELPEKEQMVIKATFGLDQYEPHNLRQISNIMGNTGERVRQIKEKGIETLRQRVTASAELGGLGIKELCDLL